MCVIHKYGPSPSRVCCIFAKSTNSNFQYTLLFESRIGNFPKTLLLVKYVKTHKLLQVCKQVVTNLFTSCQQVVFALLVPSCCNKFETSC
jgi:hypothetical protein